MKQKAQVEEGKRENYVGVQGKMIKRDKTKLI